MIGKKSNTLQKGKQLPAGRGKTMQQETLGTQSYAQITGPLGGVSSQSILDN